MFQVKVMKQIVQRKSKEFPTTKLHSQNKDNKDYSTSHVCVFMYTIPN